MLWNRGLWYLGAALALAALAIWPSHPVLRFLLLWCAASFAYVALGYLFSFNELLLKSRNGVVPLPIKLLLLPFFALTHVYNWQARRRDAVPAVQEIEPGLFLGRRLFASDVPMLKELDIGAVLDVTVEFDALDLTLLGTDIQYLNVPVFDHGVPRLGQLQRAVHWIDEQRRDNRHVLIHCALGRGRSSTVLIAYLMFTHPGDSIRQLIDRARLKRSTVRPNFPQLRLLERYRRSEISVRSQSACLIFNPAAGKGDSEQRLATLRTQLAPFFQLDVRQTQPDLSAAVLTRQALEAGAKLVVAAGGDGTVTEVAGQLIGSEAALGIVPLGTANALATCLYGNRVQLETIEQSCERIRAGNTCRIDTARCNDAPMLLLAGVGYESGMIERADRDLKSRWGAVAYLVSLAQEIREGDPLHINLTADGKTQELVTDSLVVANGAPPTSVLAQGRGAPLADDGLLDITWIKQTEPGAGKLLTLMDLFRAGVTNSETGANVGHLRASKIRIETDPPTKVAIDGEVCEQTPVEIRVLPLSLTVICD